MSLVSPLFNSFPKGQREDQQKSQELNSDLLSSSEPGDDSWYILPAISITLLRNRAEH